MKNTGKKSNFSSINPSPYQLVPLTKLLSNKLNGILICDGVGVGKTISAGYIILYLSKKLRQPSLVICSPTLVDKWILELSEKFKLTVFPIRSIDDLETALNELPYITANDLRCYIISSSILQRKNINEIVDKNDLFSCIIIDEIHNFRNPKTKSYNNCYNFIKNITKYRIGLTATPINNKMDDLYSELNLLFPKFTLETWEFSINDMLSQKDVSLLSPIITRFLKEKLKIHFTKRNIKTKKIKLTEKTLDLVNKNITKIAGNISRTGYPLELITYYRLANSSIYAFLKSIYKKADIKAEDEKIIKLKELLNNSNEKKWIIFCEFEETVNFLIENLTKFDYLIFSMTGKTPIVERKNIINNFKDAINGILILTSVGTEGLDMQFCSSLINYDLNWNPMVLEQRIGRIDRIGQEKDIINVYNFQVLDSIDDRIIRVLEDKLNLITNVFNIEKNTIISDKDEITHRIYEEEFKRANNILNNSKIMSILDYDDYEILKNIDINFCNIDEITKIANSSFNFNWLNKDQLTLTWIEALNKKQNELISNLDYYS